MKQPSAAPVRGAGLEAQGALCSESSPGTQSPLPQNPSRVASLSTPLEVRVILQGLQDTTESHRTHKMRA